MEKGNRNKKETRRGITKMLITVLTVLTVISTPIQINASGGGDESFGWKYTLILEVEHTRYEGEKDEKRVKEVMTAVSDVEIVLCYVYSGTSKSVSVSVTGKEGFNESGHTTFNGKMDEKMANGNTGLWVHQEGGIRSNYVYVANAPIFIDKDAAIRYLNGEKMKETDYGYIPDGYYVEDGELKEKQTEYDASIGYPLEFKYTQSIWDMYDHVLKWKNGEDNWKYNVQIQFSGKYEVRKTILSKWEKVEIPYMDITSVNAIDRGWRISSEKFDIPRGDGIVQKAINEKIGCKPFVQVCINAGFRIRYVTDTYQNGGGVSEDGDSHSGGGGGFGDGITGSDKMRYGSWVSSYITGLTRGDNTTLTVVTDEDGNIIETEEYGKGIESGNGSGSDSNNASDGSDVQGLGWIIKMLEEIPSMISNMFSSISVISSSIGNVPELMRVLMVGPPEEIWIIVGIGVSIMVVLRVLGR